MTAELARVDCWHHPITADGRQQIYVPAGQTLGQALAEYIPPWRHDDAIAIVNGITVLPSLWDDVIIGANDVIQVRCLVHGGDRGSNPLAVILSIAVIVGAPFLAGALAGPLGITSAAGVGLLTAGIQFAGLLVVNALFPPRLPGGGQEQPSQQFSISGGANQARLNEPIMMLLGQHRIFPDLAAQEYTEYGDNNEQFLNQIFDFGIGNLEIGAPRIGDTPLSNYDMVTQQKQVRNVTLVSGNVDSIQGGEFEPAYDNGRANGSPWITKRTAAATTSLAFDLVSIHFNANKKGNLEGRDTYFRIEWRPVGSGSWTGQDVTIQSPDGAEARNPVRRTIRTARVPAAAYDVRVRLRAAYDEDDDLARITFRPAAPVIKAFQDDNADFQGRNPLALRVKATGQLYGRLDRVNADVGARVPNWNGTDWNTAEVTSNPAAILLWWLRGYRVDGTLRAGYGLPDDNIDFTSLQLWHKFCEDQGLECNIVLTDGRNEDEVARLIAQCGWARLDISTGRYGVIYEAASRPVTAIVNPANIVAGSINVTYENENLADEVIGTYIDRDSGWQENTLSRPVPQFSITGEFPVTIRLEGITSGEQAAKELNRAAAAQFYHQRRIQWEMEDEGRTIGIGDVIGMANGLVGNGQGGRLIAIESGRTTVEVPFDVGNTSGQAWVWQLDDTVLSTTYTRTSDRVIRLGKAIGLPDSHIDDAPEAYRIMLFSSTDPYTKVRVTGIDATGPHRFRITARDELPEYYDFRTSDLSAKLIPIGGARRPAPEGFAVTETAVGERVATWTEPEAEYVGFELRYGAAGTTFTNMRKLHEGLLSGSPWTSVEAPDPGTWRFGLVAVYGDGNRSAAVYADATLGDVVLGIDGQDGNGVEYVFAVTSAANPPSSPPSDSWGFDQPQSPWTDGAPSTFSETNQYMWRSQRRVPGAPAVGTVRPDATADPDGHALWSDWSSPRIVGRWGQDGQTGAQGADGTDGLPGAEGADGTDGQGIEYVFTRTAKGVNSIAASKRPGNGWAYDTGGTSDGQIWTDGAPDLTEALPKLWRSERHVPGAPAAGTAKQAGWGDWSVPKIVGEFGRGVEIIFAVTANANSPTAPANSWGFDTPGLNADGTGTASTLWFDAAPNVSETNPYLWACRRELSGLPQRREAVAANWSSPRIVGRWGSSGGGGSDGSPAPGREFIYARTATATAPSLPDNDWGFDEPESPWSDGSPGVNAANPFLWESSRAISGTPATGDAVSDNWDAPIVIGHFGADGVAGSDGDDGNGIEFIFAVTRGTTAPGTPPSNSWGFDQPQSPWSDAAPTTNAVSPYLWMCQRRVEGYPSVGDAIANNWTTPRIVSRWGQDGDPGEDGTDGQNGRDGATGPQGPQGPQGPAGPGLTGRYVDQVRIVFSLGRANQLERSSWVGNIYDASWAVVDSGANGLRGTLTFTREQGTCSGSSC